MGPEAARPACTVGREAVRSAQAVARPAGRSQTPRRRSGQEEI